MSLYHELKRRNVHRMAALYLAAAWLVMQVVDVVEDKLPLPEWMGSAVIAVLAVGFPIALIISWFYEVTPDGISRDTDEQPAESDTGVEGRRVDFVIIAVLVAAVLVFAYDKWWLPEAPERSVAVLPFANMSADENTAFFSDGLADTLLHMLAQVPGLRVPARTSSFKFRDYVGDISEIGDTLQVGAVLEGSVQLYGEKIRVTTQLIDTKTGYHLWSGNYDRNLSDIFAVQDTIAREVVSALRLTLLDETQERLDQTQSDNVEAYTEYLLGIDNLNPGTTESLERALAHMQKAIELDPEYAQAYSALGSIYFDMLQYGSMKRAEALARAKEAASRTLEIAPESSEALAVLGTVEMIDGNQETARQLLQKAVEKGPNNVSALQKYGLYAYIQYRYAEADDVFRRALALDPLNDFGYALLVMNLRIQKRFPEALEVIAQWRKAVPESVNVAHNEATCYGLQGKYAAALQAVLTAPVDDPRDPEIPASIAGPYLFMDMPNEAREWFDKATEVNPEHPVSLAAPLWLNFYQQQNEEESVGLAQELLANRIGRRGGARSVAVLVLLEYAAKSGQHEILLELLDDLYPNLFDDPPYDIGKDWVAASHVGLALVQSGDIDRGGHLLRAYLENQDLADEAKGPDWSSVAARLALGEKEAAMTKFREFVRVNKSFWWDGNHWNLGIASQTMLRHSAIFDPIRNEPEFIELLEFYQTNAAEQRLLVQEMDIH